MLGQRKLPLPPTLFQIHQLTPSLLLGYLQLRRGAVERSGGEQHPDGADEGKGIQPSGSG